jgi:phosphatidylethanolamine-binding protein (PEBP) family uncharacterized protein
MIRESLLSALALALLATASSQGAGAGFQITSSAFPEGKEIPKRFTCDGENVSPPLAWTGSSRTGSSSISRLPPTRCRKG